MLTPGIGTVLTLAGTLQPRASSLALQQQVWQQQQLQGQQAAGQ